jgi:hypothetical protein
MIYWQNYLNLTTKKLENIYLIIITILKKKIILFIKIMNHIDFLFEVKLLKAVIRLYYRKDKPCWDTL